MISIRFMDSEKIYAALFKQLNKNIIRLLGDIPSNTSGFVILKSGTDKILGDYSDFTTVYRKIDGGVEYSNNGMVYVEHLPKVTFEVGEGGIIEGALVQKVKNYEDLIIPKPIADADYAFYTWNPEIPLSGEIKGNKTFTALFESTVVEPTEPTLEERVSVVEEDIQKINEALEG